MPAPVPLPALCQPGGADGYGACGWGSGGGGGGGSVGQLPQDWWQLLHGRWQALGLDRLWRRGRAWGRGGW